VIIIFMDDMGNGDLSCTGALEYETPAIDQLAREGIRFTNFLDAQAVCSASRAGLLTGCYPNRIGIGGALFPNSKVGLNSNEITIAKMLKTKDMPPPLSANGTWETASHFCPFSRDSMNILVCPIPMICGRLTFMANLLPMTEKSDFLSSIF